MKLRFNSCRKAIHDRRSIHGVANSFKPSLIGKGDHAVVDESMKLRFVKQAALGTVLCFHFLQTEN